MNKRRLIAEILEAYDWTSTRGKPKSERVATLKTRIRQHVTKSADDTEGAIEAMRAQNKITAGFRRKKNFAKRLVGMSKKYFDGVNQEKYQDDFTTNDIYHRQSEKKSKAAYDRYNSAHRKQWKWQHKVNNLDDLEKYPKADWAQERVKQQLAGALGAGRKKT